MRVFLLLAVALAPLLVQDEAKHPPALPQVGEPAPTFRLNDHTGKAVRVGGESETWTVVAFFPKAATPG
jgi:hypothetical protein